MRTLTFHVASSHETSVLAARLGALLTPGDLVTLEGPLGAGKTTFARALIQSLTSSDQEVPSPTFTLVQTYDTPRGEIWHFDLYRLSDPQELWELGFEEAVSGIILMEWAERARSLGIFRQALEITLAHTDGEDTRLIHLTGGYTWGSRLELLAQENPHGAL